MSKILGCTVAVFFGMLISSTQSSAGEFEQAVFSAAPTERPPVTEVRQPAAVEIVKQPVFIICPHKESAGAWSMYVLVDKNNPRVALGLGLEELVGKNSKENTYKGVLAAQKDPNTPRREIAQLSAREFGSGRLEVKENNILSIGVTPMKDGLHLEVNARVSMDGYFMVGGAAANQRDLVLTYSYLKQGWVANAPAMHDATGRNAVGRFGLSLTGIVFSAGATSVSRIIAVDDFGGAIMLMDK